MMTATTLRFARTQLGRSWVRAVALALLIGGADAAWSADPPADPLGGKWSLTYHLTVKPGHESYDVPESPGTRVTRQVYVTHACQPAFTVSPDGKFAFSADDTGCNRYEHEATSPGGAGTGVGTWQVYLKVSEGQVNADGNAVRLTLDQAFGSGSVTTVSGGMTVKTDATTTRDSDTLAVVVRSPGGTGNYQLPKGPGGYAPFSKWGSQKWELKKTSQEGTTTVYSASRDKQMAGGLLVVEAVEVQHSKEEADLAVSLKGWEPHAKSGSIGTVTAVVSNNGPSTTHATLLVLVAAGDLGFRPNLRADGSVQVLDHSDGFTKVTSEKRRGYVAYDFIYEFTLAPGASRTVEIKAKDTTPPGQTLPYSISFFAAINSILPDPNHANNHAVLKVSFDTPKKNPPKPTPSKPK